MIQKKIPLFQRIRSIKTIYIRNLCLQYLLQKNIHQTAHTPFTQLLFTSVPFNFNSTEVFSCEINLLIDSRLRLDVISLILFANDLINL